MFFDDSFLDELEELAAAPGALQPPATVPAALHEKLAEFLAAAEPGGEPLSEDGFAALVGAPLAERTNALIGICRRGEQRQALEGVENFIVFFQALVPTLGEEGAGQIKRFFFRLVPTLIHIAYNDFGGGESQRAEGRAALHNLETVLIEISSVPLTPNEGELVFRSIDQMAAFIGVGEYVMANDVVSCQLLSIISRNKLARALYRLMEVEVAVQRYLKEKLGHPTPQIRIPEDLGALAEYGPLRVLHEESAGGERRRFVQVHIPGISMLRDVVLHLAHRDGPASHDLRLDGVGSAELTVPDGDYALAFLYQPQESE